MRKLIFIVLLFLPTLAHANWTVDGNSYPHYKVVTISTTNVSAVLTNFPLKVQISADTNIGSSAKSDLSDLRFTDPSGATLYSAEQESGTITSGVAYGVFWVKIPSISSATTAPTTLNCYYGASGASAQSFSTSTWDANFYQVYHLKESGLNYADSTVNAKNLTTGTIPAQIPGEIGYGQSFVQANNNYLGNPVSLSPSVSSMTLELWLNVQSFSEQGGNAERFVTDTIDSNNRFILTQYAAGAAFETVVKYGGSNIAYYTGSITTGVWHHVVFTWIPNTATMSNYVDGATNQAGEDGTGGSGFGDRGTNFYLGQPLSGVGSPSTYMDEVRISNIARSAAWIAFDYYNAASVAGQLSWGPQQGNVVASSGMIFSNY